MSIIAELPEAVKARTPCGILFGKSSIVGRYAKLHFLRHRYTVYECLVCGQEDFETAGELMEHCKTEHPER